MSAQTRLRRVLGAGGIGRCAAFALWLAGPGCAPTEEAREAAPASFRVVTFNTGTSESLPHDAGPDDGYGPAEAARSDAWYGDGLAYLPAIDAVEAFFATTDAQVVGLQEVFPSEACADIPSEEHGGFACEGWLRGDPTVAVRVLGEGWQLACHPGKPDKCLAIRRSFGTFAGCEDDVCPDGLFGVSVPECGRGARVARGVVLREDAPPLTVVHVHGSSGIAPSDVACRVAQIEQVFLDVGDGSAGVDGSVNLVLGDLNTDPGRLAGVEASATRWRDFVGPGLAFDFLTSIEPSDPPTYAGFVSIDHVMADHLTGSCVHPGVSPGTAQVYPGVYFDHHPVVCDVRPRSEGEGP